MIRTPEVAPEEVEDIVIGCATPEAQQGMNMARQVGLIAGLPVTASAMTINRFCSSGLQAIALAAEHIMCGFSEVAIGGAPSPCHCCRWAAIIYPKPVTRGELSRHLPEHGSDG
jgi:acetyl-CoA acyltransferase